MDPHFFASDRIFDPEPDECFGDQKFDRVSHQIHLGYFLLQIAFLKSYREYRHFFEQLDPLINSFVRIIDAMAFHQDPDSLFDRL